MDDEQRSLNILLRAIHEALPEADVHSFDKPADGLADIEGGFRPDIAFLDIEMPGMLGTEAALAIKNLCPDVNVIFVTGYSEYAVDAFRMRASGYLLKPVTADQIRLELDNLRHPIEPNPEKKLVVRTFGNFEVYAGGKPVRFSRSKSKEAFAYLVDRGATGATVSEIAGVLWEDGLYDRSRQKQMQVFIHDMLSALKDVSAADVIVKNGQNLIADVDKLDCDAYRFLEGDITAINAYRGEYMAQYSWAEFTNGRLNDFSGL